VKKFIERVLTLRGLHEVKGEWLAKLGVDKFCLDLRKKTNLTPNQLTVGNIGLGLLACLLLFNNAWLFSVLLLIHLVMDGFDGHYARITGMVSTKGEKLDHWGDFGIGMLMLLKSYWYFGYWWILWLLIAFAGEMALIVYKGWGKEKFPTRMFMNIFLFGLYVPALVVQLIFQPISLAAFWWGKRTNPSPLDKLGASPFEERET
jgi:phosphatidylglycerophosphate synthase